jgi:hypothetical protein
MSISLPSDLKAKIIDAAARKQRNVSNLIAYVLAEALKQEDQP